jgi:hypothetical protein
MVMTQAVGQSLRISPRQVIGRLKGGEAVTILDARSDKAWDSSAEMIRGAIRAPADHFQPGYFWPKDQLTVAYCT